jgi:hypothetical protein
MDKQAKDPIRKVFSRRVKPMSRRAAVSAAACGLGYLGFLSMMAEAATTEGGATNPLAPPQAALPPARRK